MFKTPRPRRPRPTGLREAGLQRGSRGPSPFHSSGSEDCWVWARVRAAIDQLWIQLWIIELRTEMPH